MKKLVVALIAIVLMFFLTPMGVSAVFADSGCPTSQGWKCVNLDGSPSTLGVYIILENKGGVISQVFINGKIYTAPGEKTDCFYLEGIGTVRVNILSNCEGIRDLGWYIQPEDAATSVPVVTSTSVPVATATPTLAVTMETTPVGTSAPNMTATLSVVSTPAVKATPLTTKPIYLWVIPIGITIVVIAFLLYKKKH